MTDPPNRGHLLRAGLLFCVLLLSFARPDAQVSGRAAPEIASVYLASIDARLFPQMKTYLNIYDAQGIFIHDLQPTQVRIREDENFLAVREMAEGAPGAQFVVAINPGRSFAIRDGQGFSRYDRLVQALSSWSGGQLPSGTIDDQETGGDDYSLLITGRPETLHLATPQEWLAALEGYQADLRAADARLDVLLRAMEVAAGETPRPGMGRIILFITPPPEGDFSAGLQAILARAKQQGIRIFVWMVCSPEEFDSLGARQLQELASGTGGTLFLYSGVEPVPNVEDLLRPMRSTYFLEYDSRVTTSGPHQVSIEVRLDGLQDTNAMENQSNTEASAGVISSPQVFEVNVMPPNLVFVEPPVEILRESRIEGQTREPVFSPNEQYLDVLVEFPDGFQRSVISMTLYVDGTPAAVKLEPPFEQLTWDLSRYTEDGEHMLRVEAVDSLGLRNSSVEIPVQVNVQFTPKNFLTALISSGPLIAGLTVILAGVILALVLILGGRIQPHMIGQVAGTGRTRRGFWIRSRRNMRSDPVTQPVRGAAGSTSPSANDVTPSSAAKTIPTQRHVPAWMSRLQWPQRRLPPNAHASLVRLVETEETTVPGPIPITGEEVIFGRDPAQVTLILDDPSVEPRHARMHKADNSYRIADEGSIAGTWVNYTPVSKEGVTLEHGDLLHIGRVGFRFMVHEPTRPRKPVISREERSS